MKKRRMGINARDLKKWRGQFNWTQEEAASRLNMPIETYRNYEKKRRSIPGVVAIAMQVVGFLNEPSIPGGS